MKTAACTHPNLITLADGESVCTACELVLGRKRTREILTNRRDARALLEADIAAGVYDEVA